jgi:hypothetical protein
LSNIGKSKSNFNEVTGATIISSAKNYGAFANGYELFGTTKEQPVSLAPFTIKLPIPMIKKLEEMAKNNDKDVCSFVSEAVIYGFELTEI